MENKDLLLKYVQLYKHKIKENSLKHRFNFDEFFSSCSSKYVEKRKILIGNTVNISALGSTVPGVFKINQILCKDPNGYLVSNRQRNAAVLWCERTYPPDFVTNEEINEFIKGYNLSFSLLENDGVRRKNIGDRTMRSVKTTSISAQIFDNNEPNIQKTITNSQKMKQIQQEKNALIQMFSNNQKPRDQTSLTYSSGPFVLTGAKDIDMSKYSMWIQMWLLCWEGIPITHLKSLSIQNVVSTFKMPFKFDLERLEKKWGNNKIEFIKSPFPAAIYTIEESLINIAVERANILKQIKRMIIEDNEKKTPEEKEIDAEVARLTSGYESFQLQKKFQHNFVFENDLQKRNEMEKELNQEKLHEIFESTEDEPEKLLYMNSTTYFDKNIIPRLRKYKGKPVCLIYTPGAIVITGSHDIDVKTAFYEILYDKLTQFKIECEEEDRIIANQSCHDNLQPENPIFKEDPNKKKKIKNTIGMSETGSFMRRIEKMTQLRQIARTTKKPSHSETRKQGLIKIGSESSNLMITHEKDKKENTVVIKREREQSGSKFSDLFEKSFGSIGLDPKRSRKD